MVRSVGRATDPIGLTFIFSNAEERKLHERLKIPEQDVDIFDWAGRLSNIQNINRVALANH